jgi:hypothetical protein
MVWSGHRPGLLFSVTRSAVTGVDCTGIKFSTGAVSVLSAVNKLTAKPARFSGPEGLRTMSASDARASPPTTKSAAKSPAPADAPRGSHSNRNVRALMQAPIFQDFSRAIACQPMSRRQKPSGQSIRSMAT